MKLGKTIKRLRKERNYGLREFARMIGKSPSYLHQIEIDVRRPSTETLDTIAHYLGNRPLLYYRGGMIESEIIAMIKKYVELREFLSYIIKKHNGNFSDYVEKHAELF